VFCRGGILKEFRLMADHQHVFTERNITYAMGFFPNIKKLALGHVLPQKQLENWGSLLRGLAAFDLEELWLFDIRNFVCGHAQPDFSCLYSDHRPHP
jgi:hypothetical protein